MKTKTLLTSLTALVAVSSSFASVPINEERAYVGSFYIANESLRQSASFMDGLLLGAGGLSAGGHYADYDFDRDTDRNFEGDFETMSGSLGYLHEFDGFNLGFSATLVDATLDAEAIASSNNVAMDGEGWVLSAGASKSWEGFDFSLKASLGELGFDSTRNSQGFATKDSDYELWMYQLELAGEYALVENEDYDLSPFAKLGYISLENDNFDEDPAATDAITFADFEDETPYAELGVKGVLKSFGRFTPYATASVWRDLGDDAVELEDAADGASADVPDAAETVIKGGLGFGWMVNDAWTISGEVGFFSGDEIDGFNLGLSGSYTF
jgi:hypothetical protein